MLVLRPASSSDAPAIAALHARNWQLAYHGDFPDHYLDVECPSERLEVWTERFARVNPDMITSLVEEGDNLAGFCCTFFEQDEHGSYLDNLHVAPEYQGQGLGKRLLVDAARRVVERNPEGEIYLVVLTSNKPAIAFYERMGGRFGEISIRNLAGTPVEVIAVHWRSAELATR